MKFFRYALPVLIWMIFIFYISSLSHPPSPPAGKIPYFGEFFHFAEYLVLSFLSLRMFKNYNIKNYFVFAIVFSILYAFTDEIHQLFVPFRAFELKDLIIDSLGAVFVLVFKKTI